ncbi:MAG: UDP-N-acetylmuramoyl-tripeptide--D-alanyl-D-alanine ligase [Paracoccus sp. (in: a-proteobacteria)]|nr:UDP-N-acetylmuramoyl-tripeptide--D-alanyl-D-alanine ligase [Paracoccus sp. (in: a-proteobacteria)]
MSLWTSDDAAKATGGRVTRAWQAAGISIDSRSIAPGDLFIALTAARDGHDFVAQALAAGAAAAMVSRIPDGVAADAPLLIVEDVFTALQDLGRAGRARTGARVLAITGSVGKTSTKDMAVAALQAQGRVHAAEASLNNHWGVPLTLARMPEDTDFAVLELGMNHPGEIEPLARMARPHVAMITTVAAVHLEAFENVEGIAREKAAIFAGLEPAGVAIIPEDLEVTQILRDGADEAGAIVAGFGAQGMARVLTSSTSATGSETTARIFSDTVRFTLASPGAHFVMNAVGVLAAVARLGADVNKAAQGLSSWHPYRGRGGVEQIGALTVLDDSYNANPTSLRAGLQSLARLPEGRRIAILGDMGELGAGSPAIHRDIATWPEIAPIARIHTAGPLMRNLHDALPEAQRGLWAESADGLIARISELAQPGDIVFFKGSKSSRVASIVQALREIDAQEQGS